MSVKFQYTPTTIFEDDGKIVKRPLVELELAMNGKSLKTRALIDSGADHIMLNSEYGKFFGINFDPKNKMGVVGINGLINECYRSQISFKVEGFSELFTFPTVFIESRAVDILLGQRGFFDSFRIKFEKDHNSFELSLSKNR